MVEEVQDPDNVYLLSGSLGQLSAVGSPGRLGLVSLLGKSRAGNIRGKHILIMLINLTGLGSGIQGLEKSYF